MPLRARSPRPRPRPDQPRPPSLALLAAVAVASLVSLGCKGQPGAEGRPEGRPPRPMLPRPGPLPSPSTQAAPASSTALLEGLEPAPPEAEPDPAGPPGDLAAEIAAFTDLRSCVGRHRVSDPLLSDALEAIGYDAFATDACRMIGALKTRDPSLCSPILSSSVRGRCSAQIAMLTGDESLCPVDERVFGVPAHDASCLAAARRDARPCAALVGMERATCEGLVAHDLSRCGTDARCSRLVQRWKPVLPLTPGKTPYAGRIEVELSAPLTDDEPSGERPGGGAGERPDAGGARPDGGASERLELSREAAVGAVLVHRGKGARLMVGDPRTFFVTDEIDGGGLVIDWPEWPPQPGERRLLGAEARVTLRHRPLGALELTTASAVDLKVEQIAPSPDGPVKLRASALVGPQRAARRADFTIDTWVRDVVVVPDGTTGLPRPAASGPARPPVKTKR